MRFNPLHRRKEAKRKAEALKRPAQIPEQLKKDKAAVDKMVKILNKPVRTRYPHHEEELLSKIERKATDAKIRNDKAGQMYYEEMAKKLGNAILKNHGKWHVRDNYPYEKHPITNLRDY